MVLFTDLKPAHCITYHFGGRCGLITVTLLTCCTPNPRAETDDSSIKDATGGYIYPLSQNLIFFRGRARLVSESPTDALYRS